MSSLLDEDNSVLQSICAQAVGIPGGDVDVPEVPQVPADARLRLESDSSEKQRARQEAIRSSLRTPARTRRSASRGSH